MVRHSAVERKKKNMVQIFICKLFGLGELTQNRHKRGVNDEFLRQQNVFLLHLLTKVCGFGGRSSWRARSMQTPAENGENVQGALDSIGFAVTPDGSKHAWIPQNQVGVREVPLVSPFPIPPLVSSGSVTALAAESPLRLGAPPLPTLRAGSPGAVAAVAKRSVPSCSWSNEL